MNCFNEHERYKINESKDMKCMIQPKNREWAIRQITFDDSPPEK